MTQNIKIRNIEASDAEDFFAIRNIPSVYKYFRNPRKVTPEEHAHWFISQLKSINRRNFFVAILGGKIAGYLRYYLVKDTYDVSIAVFPQFQKKGIASFLLRRTLPKIETNGKKIQAEVQTGNIASLRFFEKHGFTRLREKRDSIIFIWTTY